MKSVLKTLLLTAALTLPSLAAARPVTLTMTLNEYRGDGAYLAVYVTDSSDQHAISLWISGTKSKYYKHFKGWKRSHRSDRPAIDGITGASITAGRSLEITVDLADALIDTGHTLHVDASVEDMRDSPNDITVELTTHGAGTPVRGRRYVANFKYEL